MKTIFDGQDYIIMLDKKTQELQQLQKGKKLEASLEQPYDKKSLKKVVSLELASNEAIDGIELKYLPEEAENWEEIQKVQVKLNDWAYNHVMQRGQFGTRYNGSDKIDIHNGDPFKPKKYSFQ
jgi:hypothetical protein